MVRVNARLPLLVLVCLLSPPTAQAEVRKDSDRSQQIDALFEEYQSDAAPGCAVLVVRQGEIVHAAGYGMADLERRVKMGPTIATRLGSVTKQFTAMGIMILNDRGKLAFDDPVTKYIPELEKRYGDAITIRHVLNHTSGLPDYYSQITKVISKPMPLTEDGARVYAEWGEARFTPGEKFEYSNPGYEMLGLIIERVSKQSFADFMKTAIFEPLGMHDSRVLDTPDEHFENRAYGYRKAKDGFALNDAHPLNLMFGAGGIYTTLEDLFRWDQALYTEKLVSQTTLDEAFRSATLNDGKKTGYGFGWGLGELEGNRRLGHGGGWVGFLTQIDRFPDAGLTVVVLSNRSDARPGRLTRQVAELYLRSE